MTVRSGWRVAMLVMVSLLAQSGGGQTPAAHRTRLILKDGSYQVVMSYTVAGDVVRYVSAERGGAAEEIPLSLVDMEATKRWDREHTPGAGQVTGRGAPAIDPELLKEEAERKSLTPEVAPDLQLPAVESVLALDYFRDTPELVPLVQSDGDLNRSTSHSRLPAKLNPFAASHQIVTLKGEAANVQMHVNRPAIYLRVGDTSDTGPGGTPFTVDTGGAGGGKEAPNIVPSDSRYVIERTEVRTQARVLYSFKQSFLNGDQEQEDVVETTTEVLPGGHWMKIVPKQDLLIGEYALVEIFADQRVNLGVWDFGVHPTAGENRDAMKPVAKRPYAMEHRRVE